MVAVFCRAIANGYKSSSGQWASGKSVRGGEKFCHLKEYFYCLLCKIIPTFMQQYPLHVRSGP